MITFEIERIGRSCVDPVLRQLSFFATSVDRKSTQAAISANWNEAFTASLAITAIVISTAYYVLKIRSRTPV